MVPAICFVGNSGSGKTTLIVQVVEELKLLGFRVGVIKHAPHSFELDRPGKDSWRFARAGSDAVALVSPEGIAVMARLDGDRYLQSIIRQMSLTNDIILIEGYKELHLPKILVSCGEREAPLPRLGDNLIAVVSDRAYHGPIPHFDNGETGPLVDLLVGVILDAGDRGIAGLPRRVEQPRDGAGRPEEFAPL